MNNNINLEHFIKEFLVPSDRVVKSDKNSLITITNILNYILRKYYSLEKFYSDYDVSEALETSGFKIKIDSNAYLGYGKSRLIQATYFNINIEQFGLLKLLYKPIPKNTGFEKRQLLEDLDKRLISFKF